MYNLATYRVVNLSKFSNADYETIIFRIRYNFSNQEINAIYDPRIYNPLPSIKYKNEDKDNINNTSNYKKYN